MAEKWTTVYITPSDNHILQALIFSTVMLAIGAAAIETHKDPFNRRPFR